MERMFSPWRMAYIRQETGGGGGGCGCVFCLAPGDADEPSRLVLGVYPRTIAICNLYPYNNGHVLLAPKRHVADLSELDRDELAELMSLAALATRALGSEYAPGGFNLGMNLGKVAGAGIADHLHLHVVPRWNGDTNFMTAAQSTRVLPESLAETHLRLRPLFRDLAP
jgi:ATP adenylyltransferase